MHRTKLAACLVALTIAAPLGAQAPDPSAQIARSRAALAPIAKLVGRWEGEARVMQGPGEPIRVLQSEDIVYGASQTMIFIRGTGRDPSTRAINFEAAASIWFDAEAGRLRMRTHRDGQTIEPELEVRPDTILWAFNVPGGKVRYTITLTDSAWHEVGTFARNGGTPFQIIDMRLRRVAP